MQDLDRALIDIANIRGQLASGTVFQGFGPMVMATTGLLALVVMTGQLILPDILVGTDSRFLLIWVAVAIISAALIGAEARARAYRHHGGMADQMVMNAIEQFLPAGFAGAAIGAVLFYFNPDTMWLLPGLWQMLVALGIFTALRSLPQQIMFVAAWYFLAGICVLIIAAKGQSLHPLMMGIPFVTGQFLTAFLLHIAQENQDDPR